MGGGGRRQEEEDQELALPVSHPSASQWHPIVFHLAFSVRLPPGDTRRGRRRGSKTYRHNPRAQKRSHRSFQIDRDGRSETPRTAWGDEGHSSLAWWTKQQSSQEQRKKVPHTPTHPHIRKA